jgi:hypothetical protein
MDDTNSNMKINAGDEGNKYNNNNNKLLHGAGYY